MIPRRPDPPCNGQHSHRAAVDTGPARKLDRDEIDRTNQAAAFQRWADTCSIDWTVAPRAPLPHPPKPPERAQCYSPAPSWRRSYRFADGRPLRAARPRPYRSPG